MIRIAVAGKGKAGGGLANLWARTSHQVTRIGRVGGDLPDAGVALPAMPGGAG